MKRPLSFTVIMLLLTHANLHAQSIEEIVVTSPRLSYSGNQDDFQRYIRSLSDGPRQGFDLASDIAEAERQCENHAKRERGKCEAQTMANTVGRIESQCVGFLGQADTETTFTSVLRGITGSTSVTTARGIELYDRCVDRANRVEQSILKVCENIERNADCEFQ